METRVSTDKLKIIDLAKVVNVKEGTLKIKERNFNIPFFVVMIILTVGIFSLAIIPTCVIVFSSANSVAELLATKIVEGTATGISSELNNIFQSVKNSSILFTENSLIRNTLMTKTTGYGEFYDVNVFAKNIFEANPTVETIGCIQRYNLTGQAPHTNEQLVLNYLMIIKVPGNLGLLHILFCDQKNTTACFLWMYNTEIGAPIQESMVVWPVTALHETAIYKKIFNCDIGGNWISEVFGRALFTYTSCPSKKSGSHLAPYACGSVFSAAYALPMLLNRITPTENSIIYFTGPNGEIIVTSLNGTEHPPIINNAFISAKNFSFLPIREISRLLSPSNNWTLDMDAIAKDPAVIKSDSKGDLLQYELSDASIWIVIALKLQFGTVDSFYAVLAIPRKDFFEDVDRSIKTGVTVSSTFITLGIIIGILVTIGVVIPLRKLKANIAKVTEFDFSMLSSGGLEEQSIFTEIKVVQRTFNIMVKAFAAGIQQNKLLATKSIATATAVSKI